MSPLIYGIKGENWANRRIPESGPSLFQIFAGRAECIRFNPLAEIRLFTPRDVSDAQNIANMIVRTGEDSPQERYWQDAAASITTGMILHVCYEARAGRPNRVSGGLGTCVHNSWFSRSETRWMEFSISSTTRSKHDWHMPTGERIRDSSRCQRKSAGDAR